MTALSNQPAVQSTGDAPADLLAALLDESRELTVVERFSKAHDEDHPPAQEQYYRDLIPLTAPGEGQQYAFEVDLDACSGCKACVSACHHLNGLESEETWRNVGQLYGQNGLPVIQHVTTACHHCVDPACLSGCPTNAYEKDPDTGIVRHLDDQCFGCQYCTMTCPYEVPQYSESKGIVRKCDMCHGRLAAGEAPACVQACPSSAIKITLVDVADTVEKTDQDYFLPSTPDASLTHPTTVYRGADKFPSDLRGANADHATVQHAHLPLAVMLVLTQLSLGGVAFGALARWSGLADGGAAAIVLATLAGLGGLGLAPLHLGRPHLAYRSILGWRHSWLSREALVFGLFAPMAIGASAFAVLPLVEGWLPESINNLLATVLPVSLRPLAEVLAVVAGTAGVYCSAMIYIFTGRRFWIGQRTFVKYFGVSAVLGMSITLAAIAVVAAWQGQPLHTGVLVAGVILASILKLSFEGFLFTHDQPSKELYLTARLMRRELQAITLARFAFGLLGGVVLPLAFVVLGLGGWSAAITAVASFGCLLLGEVCERALYFMAVVPLRMPGGFKS